MKNNNPISWFVLGFVLLFSSNLFGQDQIILRSAEEIRGKVTDIKIDLIIYKAEENPNGPSIELKKSDVLMIIYENGTTHRISEPRSSSDSKSDDPESNSLDLDRPHHIVSYYINAPEIGIGLSTNFSFGLTSGFSYEYQSRKKKFGLRVSPGVGLSGFGSGTSLLAIVLPISPRLYLVHGKRGQFYIGFEGTGGTTLDNYNLRNFMSSFILSGHIIFGGHVFSGSKFNFNTEAGTGYEYRKFGPGLNEIHTISVFLRWSFGARLTGKAKE